MKILLSAFNCAPDMQTPDDEMGWQWAIALARSGRDVTVLTAARNRDAVEAWLARNREVTIGFRFIADAGGGRLAGFIWQIAALLTCCCAAASGGTTTSCIISHRAASAAGRGSGCCRGRSCLAR
jgi:hypothetical protein